ncbi:MAG: hypothetical protein ACI4JI_09285, partial [Ruminiclostridium sp.]
MKASTNKKNHSAAKKLIPAIAMLVTSATMLSTATYAWFTMNKEVELTGLNMTATTAGALEISLGGVTAGGVLADNFGTRPADTLDELSWKQSIAAGEYYNKISLINPASSVDAVTFYDAMDASNAGQTATKFETVSQTATLTKQPNLTADGVIASDEDTTGYYVEIPVHLRTSSVAPQGSAGDAQIYYKMVLNNNDIANIGSKTLYKAVRVAFLKADETGAVTSASAEKILAIDDAYYGAGAVSAIDGSNVGTKSAVTALTTDSVFTSTTDTNYGTN